MTALLSGFALGFSLILAIGAQNAFILRQGIRGEHVGPVVLVCIVSDGLLILAGVAGFGALSEAVPVFETVMRWGGAAFLLGYGALAFWKAFTGDEALAVDGSTGQSLKAAIATVLALTWLNPHVYLDTVVLLGSVSAQFGKARWVFALGAVAASTTFFLSLGYGARALQPVFARPGAWRLLDVCVGALMWTLAVYLILP
ncbi:LysE/ArgO family amino acid transporter [Boseongicola aestuarii]|uniref:Arginine exporter protein ArgO n=1 Tax=Boseongicola aestuarii TaxID=1470561 RepID=A0A238IZQ1_9RHOB|nr:LysE/ArgO family amino acid transporter [Boseongicola aestuarii]SMX23521.1 Arginine exporter protein ArgO [Boseongicola aestuarii]